MSDPNPSPIRYRLGLNQPAYSPTARRMAEMAEAIGRDTGGAFELAVFPESRLGPDPPQPACRRAQARAQTMTTSRKCIILSRVQAAKWFEHGADGAGLLPGGGVSPIET